MNTITRTTAAVLAAGGLLAVTLASAAHADTERQGALRGGGQFGLTVDREDDGRFDVSVDLDGVAPGSRWKVVLRQDGERFVRTTVTADSEGEVDLDRTRPDTARSDRFALVLTGLGTGQTVRTAITR